MVASPFSLVLVLCCAAADDSPPVAKPAGVPTLRVVVQDPQGKPLPGANVKASIWTEEKDFKATHDYQSDASGAVQVELPKTYYILRLWASKKPFVSKFANWEQKELASGKGIPSEYTFRLEPAAIAGGRIVDEQGQPIAGAKVQLRVSNDPQPADGDGRARYNSWLATDSDAATTDADGRWRVENVPSHPQVELSLMVSHGDYLSDEHWGQLQKAADITTAMLLEETATLTLKRGIIIRGQVTDPSGQPIENAVIVQGDNPYSTTLPSKFSTDAQGRFQLPALAPRETSLTVIAAGWAPQFRQVNLQAGLPPQNFRMEPGKPIRLRIVDAAGKPVPNAYVSLVGWKGSQSIQSSHNPNHPKVPDTKIPRRTDADGIWEWSSAPDDPVKVHISAKSFAGCELEIAGGVPEETVVLKAEHRVTGRVSDAVTGQPIPAFTIIPIDVFRKDWLHAERGNAERGKDGRLDYLATRIDIPLRLRIEAPGYRTQDGPQFRVGDDAARTQDFRLQPSPPVTGIVVDASGQPAADAEVLLATPTQPADLGSDGGNHKTTADVEGRFAFPDPGEPFALLARTKTGFALAEYPVDQHDVGPLRLRPWASVRGQFRDGGRLVRGATIMLQPVRIDGLDRPRIKATMQAVTGADGRFELPRVPPGPVSVRVHLGPWEDEGFYAGPSVPLDLQAGQQAELDLGGAGALVTGKVTLTGKVPADLNCTYSLNYLVRRAPGITPPPEIAHLGFDARSGWRDTWRKTVEGQAYFSTLHSWFVKLAPDGGFRISGVPPGEYDLAIAVYARPDG
ncbi:MAG: carboxypeptidase-like regulatory domain-containing protein [Pirellulaceae bacterium]